MSNLSPFLITYPPQSVLKISDSTFKCELLNPSSQSQSDFNFYGIGCSSFFDMTNVYDIIMMNKWILISDMRSDIVSDMTSCSLNFKPDVSIIHHWIKIQQTKQQVQYQVWHEKFHPIVSCVLSIVILEINIVKMWCILSWIFNCACTLMMKFNQVMTGDPAIKQINASTFPWRWCIVVFYFCRSLWQLLSQHPSEAWIHRPKTPTHDLMLMTAASGAFTSNCQWCKHCTYALHQCQLWTFCDGRG